VPAPLCFFRFLSLDQAEWLHPNSEVQRGPLPELATQVSNVRLILIAPGEAITLHQIPLPGRKRALWARAVPYALEDQLIDDIETLHFALSQTLDGDRLPVATVDHAVLRGWLETCAQAGLTPVAVIPDFLLLPWQEGDWSILPDGQRIVVRTGRWTGLVTEPETLGWFLNQALVEAGDAKPQRLRSWGSPPQVTLDMAWQIENDSSEPLLQFAAGYRPETVLNLLQGPYGRQAPWKRGLRPWRTAAILAGVWLIVQGGGQIYEHGRLQREQIALNAAMEQIYKDTVPGATRIVNPKVQMESRLRELAPAGAGGGGVFLELLYQGGQPLVNFPDITLRGVSYREGQLDLVLEGGNPAVLDQFRQQLEQRPGIQAEMRTTQREGRMESKVTLKKMPS